MSPEDQKRLRYQGQATVTTQLSSMTRGGLVSVEAAETYAAGMAEGIRDFVKAYVSDEAAYNLFQHCADGLIAERASKEAKT